MYRKRAKFPHAPAEQHDFINSHLIGYVGNLVSKLVEERVLSVPESFLDDEGEERDILSWYQVDEDMANRLRAASQCVVEFEELYLWGRASWGISLHLDIGLMKSMNLFDAEELV